MTLEINYQTNTINGLEHLTFSESVTGDSVFSNVIASSLNITGGNSNFALTPTISGANLLWHAGNLNPTLFATTITVASISAGLNARLSDSQIVDSLQSTAIQDISASAFSMSPANSGNFLTWDQNNNLVDSNNIFTRTVTISSAISSVTGADLLCYGAVNPLNKMSEIRDDFISSAVASVLGWAAVNNGTNAASSIISTFGFTTTEKAYGVVQLTTGTTATGRANLNLGTDVILFGYGEYMQRWRLALSALSTGTQTYQVRVGFIDSTANTEPVDGVYFEYDTATSPNWRICAASNSVRTKTTTTSVVQATSFAHMWIFINSAGTRADFYVDRVFLGSVTTNIPTAAGRTTGIGVLLNKTVGTTANLMYIDYFANKYTTDRV